jgi:hypothetical protein
MSIQESDRNRLFAALISGQRDGNPQPGQLITRAATMSPGSLDKSMRTVRCCLTTEDPVRVYDWMSGRIVMETLMVDRCEFGDSTPMLRDHNQYTVKAIIGGVSDHGVDGDQLMGTLEFGKDLDEETESIWRRVEAGYLKKGSIGYDYTSDDYVTIPAGKTVDVEGRSFTAPAKYELRVVFRWRLREFSMVVIPADDRAQMRAHELASQETNQQRGTGLNVVANSVAETDAAGDVRSSDNTLTIRTDTVDELTKFLRQHGLSESVVFKSIADALLWARRNLGRGHFKSLHDLASQHFADEFIAEDFPIDGERSATESRTNADTSVETRSQEQIIADERARQTAIRNLHTQNPSVSEDVLNRCLNDGLTIEQAKSAFYDATLATRSAPVGPGSAPAGHVRGGMTLMSLQAGMLARCGITPDSEFLRDNITELAFGHRNLNLGWLRGASRTGQARDQVEAAFDAARNQRIDTGSFMRFAEAIVELEDGYRSTWHEDEIMERAFSSGSFNAIFGAVVHMMMVQGFVEQPRTYEQIARIKDVPDFRPNQEAHTNGVGRLKKMGMNGGEAALLNIEDPTIASVAAERYAGQLKISDQVILQDSFDVLDMGPAAIGASAAAIPADLLLAMLLRNPNLSDGNPLFITGTNKIVGGTLDENGLNAAGVLMENQTVNGNAVVVRSGVLFHGTTLGKAAKKVIDSAIAHDNSVNTQQNEYRRIKDNRVDLGVRDPADNDRAVAGKPGSYYTFALPLRSLVVAFRRGTNRGPVTRSGRLPVGQFGAVWDVYIDTGVAATSRIGVVEVETA